jgi:hypothetical protein
MLFRTINHVIIMEKWKSGSTGTVKGQGFKKNESFYKSHRQALRLKKSLTDILDTS